MKSLDHVDIARIIKWVRNFGDPYKSMEGYAVACIISDCLEKGCWKGTPCDYCKASQDWWKP